MNNYKNKFNIEQDDNNEMYDDYELKLLKQQEEFLKSGEKPSSSVSRAAPPPILSSKRHQQSSPPFEPPQQQQPPQKDTPILKPVVGSTSKFKHQKVSNNGIPIIDEPMGDEKDIISLGSGDNYNNIKSTTSNITSGSRFKINQQQQQQKNVASTSGGNRKPIQPKYEEDQQPFIEEYEDNIAYNDSAYGETYEDVDQQDIFNEKRDNHITSIISGIYERDVSDSLFEPPKKNNIGFPEAVHRSLMSFSSKNKQSTSNNTFSTKTEQQNKEQSTSNDIEEENKKKIESMSTNEILENQEYLLKHLDPKIVEMLKNRSKTKSVKPDQQQSQQQKQGVKILNKNELDETIKENITNNNNPIKFTTTTTTNTANNTTTTNNTNNTTTINKEKSNKSVKFDNNIQVKDENKKEESNNNNNNNNTNITTTTTNEPEFDETTIWMKDLDKFDSRVGFKETILNFKEWRFGFNGDIIQRGSDISINEGLHHHGLEASEAGYTINEIIMLIKSSNHSQKSIALKTLTQILQKIHSGYYGNGGSRFNKLALFEEILKLKIPRLLRVSIDSPVPSIQIQSLTCLHSLIVPMIEENAYEMIELRSHRSYETISIKPISKEEKSRLFQNEEEEPEKDDDEKCQQDLINGLIHMGIMNRLKYLLDNEAKSNDLKSMSTDPFFKSYLSRLSLILDILIRFTRHSNQLSESIFQDFENYLLNIIKSNLIDFDQLIEIISSSSTQQDHSLIKSLKSIQIKSIRLLRRISQSSKHIATCLTVSSTGLFELIKQKFTECKDNQILCEYIKLFRIWFIYRIQIDDFFFNILPTLNNYVNQFTEILNHEAYNLSKVQNQPTTTAEEQKEKETKQELNSTTTLKEDIPIKFSSNFQNIIDSHIMETVRTIFNLLDIMMPVVVGGQQLSYYDSISHFIEPSFVILQTIGVVYHSFREKESDYNLLSSMGLSSSVLHFVSTFFASLNRLLVLPPNHLDKFQFNHHNNTNTSSSSKNILDLIENNTNLIFTSIFGSTLYSDVRRKILSLVSLNSSSSGDDNIVPINFNFFFEGEVSEWWLSVSRYLILSLEINRSIGKLIFYMDQSNFFYHLHSMLVSTIDYRKSFFNQDRDLILSNYRSKTYLYFYLLKLMNELRFEQEEFDPNLSKFHHSSAMALIPTFLPNDDIMIYDLLSSTIFQNDYLESIGCLKTSSVSVVLKLFYQDRFFPSKTLEYSQILYRVDDSDNQLDDLFISFESENSLLPLKYDWFNLPIEFLYQSSVELYNANNQNYFDEQESDWNEDMDSPPLILNTLLFIQSLYNTNSQYIHSIPLENTYQILMKIFLLRSEPWKHQEISKLLKHLLNVLIINLKQQQEEEEKQSKQLRQQQQQHNDDNDKMDIDEEVQSTPKEFDFEGYFGQKFYQFYQEFIQHFASVSFASEIFSSFIWIFLRQSYSARYRLLLWNELNPTLNYLQCNDQQLPLGNDGYLIPIESNTELLATYKNSLCQKKTTRYLAPKLYLIAIHHLSNYVFYQQEPQNNNNSISTTESSIDNIYSNGIKSQYLSSILSDAPKETIIDFLSYFYQKDCNFSFTSQDASEISDERKLLINQFIDKNSFIKDKFKKLNLF